MGEGKTGRRVKHYGEEGVDGVGIMGEEGTGEKKRRGRDMGARIMT